MPRAIVTDEALTPAEGLAQEIPPTTAVSIAADSKMTAAGPLLRRREPVILLSSEGRHMKLDNYVTRWQEFRDWSVSNRPELVTGVDTLGDELRDSIHQYREATDPDTRHLRMEHIKQHYDRVVQWHMEAILSKLDGE